MPETAAHWPPPAQSRGTGRRASRHPGLANEAARELNTIASLKRLSSPCRPRWSLLKRFGLNVGIAFQLAPLILERAQ
jgi:hypothetical protein